MHMHYFPPSFTFLVIPTNTIFLLKSCCRWRDPDLYFSNCFLHCLISVWSYCWHWFEDTSETTRLCFCRGMSIFHFKEAKEYWSHVYLDPFFYLYVLNIKMQFEDARDAEDAIQYRDGYNFDGFRLRVSTFSLYSLVYLSLWVMDTLSNVLMKFWSLFSTIGWTCTWWTGIFIISRPLQ